MKGRNTESLCDLVDNMVTISVKRVEGDGYLTMVRNKPRPERAGNKHFDLPMMHNLNAQFDEIFKL